jgi:hypothetical protein
MTYNCEVIRAEWLSRDGKVILVSLVDNRERHRVECEESEVDLKADLLVADLEKLLGITHPASRAPAFASRRAQGRHLWLVSPSSPADAPRQGRTG